MKSKILFSALLAASLFSFNVTKTNGYKPGDIAKDFSLLNVDGKMVSMADYNKEAKGYILVFTCNHCPYSVAYEDRIIALNEKYAKQGFPVIAINPNDAVQYPSDSYAEMQVRAKEKGFTFPYLHDETQQTAKEYGAERTPHVYIVQRQATGSFVVKYVGAIDNNTQDAATADQKYAENAVNALLKGSEPETTLTKAIGCGIKWKK
jgi:peroxiredoxin